MAAVSKPVTGAFIIDSQKASAFFAKKPAKSSDAISRFENRKTKSQVASNQNK